MGLLLKNQFKLLKVLTDDPRMQVSKIAKKAGMTVTRARKTLNEIVESDAVFFGTLTNVNAGSSTRVVSRISWDEKQTNAEELVEWAKNEYPEEFDGVHITASEPRMFLLFYVEHVREAETIARNIQSIHAITHHQTVIPYPAKLFTGIRQIKLEEMIREAGV